MIEENNIVHFDPQSGEIVTLVKFTCTTVLSAKVRIFRTNMDVATELNISKTEIICYDHC